MSNLLTPLLNEFEAESAALHARYRARIGERVAQARDVINAELSGVLSTAAKSVHPRSKAKAKRRLGK